MAVPPAPDVGSVTDPATGPETPHIAPQDTHAGNASRGFRLGLLLVLVAVLVASLAVTGYLVATRTSDAAGGTLDRVGGLLTGEDAIAEEREAVMAVASQFMLRVNTYGPDDLAEDGTMPDYREQVGELITPAFRADFDAQVGTAEQTVSQAQLGRACEVFGVGLSTMDADSATALVAGAFTNSYPGSGRRADERIDSQPAPFRVEVTLVKVAGEWLVDDFAPVTGQGVTMGQSEEASGTATEQPTDQPSQQSSEQSSGGQQ